MTAPARLGENAPAWLCPSAPSFRSPHLTTRIDPDPTPEQLERKARLHAEALARQAARSAAHAAKLAANAERKADEKRRRAELAAQNKAADLARKAEERRRAQAARLAAKAAKPKPKKRAKPKKPAPAVPAGWELVPVVADRVGYNRTVLSTLATSGKIPSLKVGRNRYVMEADVRAYRERMAKVHRDSTAKARAAWVAQRQARKRGAA